MSKSSSTRQPAKEAQEIKSRYSSAPSSEPSSEPSFHLFVSFDLVNFTRTKYTNTGIGWTTPGVEWTKILAGFYYELGKNCKPCQVWKLRGDEVVLKWDITDATKIPPLLPTLLDTSKALEDSLYKEYNIRLQIKITAWILEAYHEVNIGGTNREEGEPNRKEGYKLRNISFASPHLKEEHSYLDFVGPHMDAGFRLTGCALPTVIVLSVELEYIIYQISEEKLFEDDRVVIDASQAIMENLKVVGFRKFKGIGNGAPYPIIWYSKNWTETKNLYYLTAEHHDHSLLKELVAAPKGKDPVDKEKIRHTAYYKDIKKDTRFLERLSKLTEKKTKNEEFDSPN